MGVALNFEEQYERFARERTTEKYKEVSKDEFFDYLKKYPNELQKEPYGITEPPSYLPDIWQFLHIRDKTINKIIAKMYEFMNYFGEYYYEYYILTKE